MASFCGLDLAVRTYTLPSMPRSVQACRILFSPEFVHRHAIMRLALWGLSTSYCRCRVLLRYNFTRLKEGSRDSRSIVENLTFKFLLSDNLASAMQHLHHITVSLCQTQFVSQMDMIWYLICRHIFRVFRRGHTTTFLGRYSPIYYNQMKSFDLNEHIILSTCYSFLIFYESSVFIVVAIIFFNDRMH